MPANVSPGSPIWVDLTVQDLDAAKDFYSEIFGWDFTDMGPEYGHYHLIRSGDSDVGGAMRAMTLEGPAPDMPSTWSIYLKSVDADATVRAAETAGGQVALQPMDVGSLGRMAELTDPAGGRIGVWQPYDFEGFDVPLTPGTLAWFEVMSTDMRAALPFYEHVFGWKPAYMGEDGTFIEDADDQGTAMYATNAPGAAATAGICDAAEWFDASQWRLYVSVEDADGTAQRIVERGGAVLDGPMDSPFGRVVTVADPEGASFQINQPPA